MHAQGRSQTFLITEAIAKCGRHELLAGSRRSEMPFLAFLWWYFSLNIIKIQTTFNSIPVCYQFLSVSSSVSFRNEVLEALKSYFSIRGEKNINPFQVHQFKCTCAEVY